MAQRWAVVRLLDDGKHYAEISRTTGASTATITRIASWLHHGEGRLSRGPGSRPSGGATATGPMTERLRLAIPNKGRMVEPTLRLLHDAGLVFDEHDRILVARVQNFDLDILFVRTNDIIEFVGDGVADLGITGIDLLTETGAELPRIRELGYGRCRLAAAVPNDSAAPDRRGPRGPARRHRPPEHRPTVLRRARHRRRHRARSPGAVEVAPRLGLAEAHRRSRVDRARRSS